MPVYVTNDQPCTLVIGGVRINGGESKPVPAQWEGRCKELASIGAMRVTGEQGPVQKPAKARAAALLAELTDVERAELLGQFAPKVSDKSPAVEGAPEDFTTWHWQKAKAWVEMCDDAKVLHALGNVEQRQSVLSSIIDRINLLEAETAADKD
jgi:hypothetical protein